MSKVARLFNNYLHVLSSSLVCRLLATTFEYAHLDNYLLLVSFQCSQWLFHIVRVIEITYPRSTQILEPIAVTNAINWWWVHPTNTGFIPFLLAISLLLSTASSRQNLEGMNRSLNDASDHHSEEIKRVIQHPNPDIEQ